MPEQGTPQPQATTDVPVSYLCLWAPPDCIDYYAGETTTRYFPVGVTAPVWIVIESAGPCNGTYLRNDEV